MVLKLLDGGGGGGGDDGFNPSAAEHKRHEQIGNLAVELKHQRLASKPSAMLSTSDARADRRPHRRARAPRSALGDTTSISSAGHPIDCLASEF
ncbi:hypothetical protein DAI22_08g029000 [Oryza sativa Japonica Group]|nr:hypothetical protein DAI22_08g029000 [Oryza sativa Japonica Group]KAF2918051.1 hypothetical protein DAI22_08g029000 [Oryza sativa Japonica Group]